MGETVRKKIEIFEDGVLIDRFYLDEDDIDFLAEQIGELQSFNFWEEDE